MLAGDQVLTGIDIRPVETWIEKRRGANTHMDFFRPCFPEQRDDPPAGRSPDNRIIDQNDSFILNDSFYNRKLNLHLIQPVSGINECPADIFILYQPYIIRDPR